MSRLHAAAALVFASLAACGGSSSAPASGGATVSGPISGSLAGEAPDIETTNNSAGAAVLTQISVSARSAINGANVDFALTVSYSGAFDAGTYSAAFLGNTDGAELSELLNESSGASWYGTANGVNGAQTGSYTLVVTDTGAGKVPAGTNTTVFAGAHGSYSATMPVNMAADAGPTDAGPVTVTGTF